MSVEYADYTRDRVGFFFGMTGPQLATVMAAGVPLLLAVGVQRWALAGLCLLGFAAVVVLVVVPVRGRSATQWIGALVAHTIARLQFWRDMGILYVKDNGQWEEVREYNGESI